VNVSVYFKTNFDSKYNCWSPVAERIASVVRRMIASASGSHANSTKSWPLCGKMLKAKNGRSDRLGAGPASVGMHTPEDAIAGATVGTIRDAYFT